MIAFFDASALIYLVEGAESFASRNRRQIEKLRQRTRNLGTAVSQLSWLECRIRPARRNESATLALYDAFSAKTDLLWIELTRDVVELAADIRIRHGRRTPDSLQAASCLPLGPRQVFLTGNRAFKSVFDLNAQVLA